MQEYSIWTGAIVEDAEARHPGVKFYRCTDYGADAIAYEEEEFFVICAGSRFAPASNRYDGMMLRFRDFLARNGAFEVDGATLKGDERFLFADEAARIVTGRICDELSWIAVDGSHPDRISPAEDREIQRQNWPSPYGTLRDADVTR